MHSSVHAFSTEVRLRGPGISRAALVGVQVRGLVYVFMQIEAAECSPGASNLQIPDWEGYRDEHMSDVAYRNQYSLSIVGHAHVSIPEGTRSPCSYGGAGPASSSSAASSRLYPRNSAACARRAAISPSSPRAPPRWLGRGGASSILCCGREPGPSCSTGRGSVAAG